MRRVPLFLVMICALLCSSLCAQSYLYNIGNQQWGTNLPIENGFINVNNGEIHMEFPLATHTQRGGLLQLQERLVYDSRIWQIVNSGSSYSFQPTNVPNSQGGWRFIAGNETGGVSTSESTQNFDCYVDGYSFVYAQDTDYFFQYQDPSGAWHMFSAMTQQPYGSPYNPETSPCQGQNLPNPPNQATASGNATDGSGYSISVTDYTSAVVYDASGNQVYPSTIDRNGNYYSTDSNGNLVDTIGRTPVLKTINGNQTYYDVLTSGGGRARYTVTTSTIPVQTGFGQQAVAEYIGNISVISSVGLPDGSSYTFNYDYSGSANGGSPVGYGELTSVTLPTGGVVSYKYLNYLDSFKNFNRWLSSRTRDGGTTTYTPKVLSYCSSSSGCQEQVAVTSPASNDTVYTFNLDSGAITQGKSWNTNIAAYQGSSTNGGTVLQSSSSQYTYQTSYAQCPGPNPNTPSYCSANVPVSLAQTHTLSDVNLVSQTVTSFNYPWVNPTSVQFWDYYSGSAPSSPTQTATYGYADYFTFELPSQVSVTDGGGNLVSRTTYAYDETSGTGHAPLVNVSVPQQPMASPTYRANLTTTTQWVNSAGTTLSTMAAYDTAGMVRSTTGPNGTTSYAYDGTGAYASTVTPPTPSSGVSLASNATTDDNIGLGSTTTDANGTVQKVPSYDVFNRPNEQDTIDSGGNTWARTTFTYYPTALVQHIYQNSSVYTDSEVLYDGFGRSSRTAVSNGQSSNPWYQQDTCYDTSGNISFVSTSYSGTGFGQAAVCSGTGDTYTYDALGRPKSITHADGSHVSYSYTGRATQYTDENGVIRITQVDGLGRIAAVCEISSNSSMPNSGAPTGCGLDIAGTGFLTTYTYNLAGHTTTIAQGSQQRSFTTDAAGRMTSVIEPERGTTTYSYSYNPTGLQVVRTRPSANQTNPSVTTTTTTQYDSLNRVVTVSYSDGTPTKSFFYDKPASGWYEAFEQYNMAGRLALAYRTSSAGASIGTLFSYNPTGTISANYACTPSACGNASYDKSVIYYYDMAGNLTGETDSAGNSYTYSRSRAGEVTSITNLPSGATNPQTVVASVQNSAFGPTSYLLGNNLTQAFGYDTLGRLTSGSLYPGTNSNSPLFTFGANWRGSQVLSANDTLEGSETFGYDQMNRLTSMSQNYYGNQYSYQYVYDRWGNRWQQNALGGGPSPQTSFDITTNRSTQASYDAAGNESGDGFHGYLYDADGNVTQVDSSTAFYTYDALNQRVRLQRGDGTYEFTFDKDGQRVATWNPQGFGLDSADAYWDGTPLAFWSGVGLIYEHQDWLGTERFRTSASGQFQSSYYSLPFGDGYGSNGNDYDWHHFAGTEFDGESGTQHAQFRQYSSTQGHWMSPDPYDGSYDATNPQSFNRYSYVMNSPATAKDPSGQVMLASPSPDPASLVLDGAFLVTDVLLAIFADAPSFQGTLEPRPDQNFQRYRITDGNHAATPDPTVANGPGFIFGDPSFCLMQNIAAANEASHQQTNVNVSNVTGTQWFNGDLSVNFADPNVSSSVLPPGRYSLSIFNYFLGLSPSLHVPKAGGADPSVYGMRGTTFNFTTHFDSAYSTPHTPIGALKHWYVDVRDHGAHRTPCGD